jgi:signal transduction histidine kinase
VLAISSVVALYFDPAQPSRYATLAYVLLVLYSVYSCGLSVLLRFRTQVSTRFSLSVHAADIVWPAVISLFTDGPNSPFFLYFIFALLAAAFRWGMREALLTAAMATGTLLIEAFGLTYAPLAGLIGTQFDANGLIMRAVYLAIFGFLIGYLAESEKQRRAQALNISRLSAMARVEAGLKGTLHAVLPELLKLFRGRALLLLTRETETNRTYLWRTEALGKAGETVLTCRQLDNAEAQGYLFPLPDDWGGAVWRGGGRMSTILIDGNGARIRHAKCYLPKEFPTQRHFNRLLMSSVSFSPAVSARLFVLDPKIGWSSETQLRLFRNLVNQVAPAVYNVYLLRRLRSRATAVERARVARDLHDGVVQSLHAIGFRLYALRTQTTIDAGERDRELLDIQQVVQDEAANVRTLIQQLKPLDFDPRHLVDFLAGMIERYRSDTGIAAKFVCNLSDVAFPPHICREVASIVQEALVNVAKHSGAANVLVRLGAQEGFWVLTVDDDGRGFEFCGRFSHSELEHAHQGPLVIHERVRAIGGELSIDTRPGRGARLEIKIPQQELHAVA